MLHRAANNAYSWWWASHIRTKQSKWLDNNLQEMEGKVQYMLKLIDEDGDSFARRAESYYRKRPELINFVEEFYRAYRALAEKYDHISGELQNANHTIATVFPDRVQFAMDEDDESGSPHISAYRQPDPSKVPKSIPDVPKAIPKFIQNLKKGKGSLAKACPKRTSSTTTINSQMSKDEAIQEIDKLQKEILALQTEKEFVKSSYENRLEKYWEIEKAITEMQQKVSDLQDEFRVGTLIEDHEARTLMAATALNSCQETLVQLQEKQERSNEEARVEQERIKEVHNKFEAFKGEVLPNQTGQNPFETEVTSEGPTAKLPEQGVGDVKQETVDAVSIVEKIKEQFEIIYGNDLSVSELAEKIDELATKVISMETAVSTQTALIRRLRSETDSLQEDLRSLEEDKGALLQDSAKLNEKLRELGGKLHAVQDLGKNVENQNKNLQTHFTETHCNLDHLSEKLKCVKPDEETEITGSSVTEPAVEPRNKQELGDEMVPFEESVNEKEKLTGEEVQEHNMQVTDQGERLKKSNSGALPEDVSEASREITLGDGEKPDSSRTEDTVLDSESQEDPEDQEYELNWQQLLSNGLEERERLLLGEYTAIVRKYKEARKQLSELQRKNNDSQFETIVQLKELKNAIAMKDEEIQSLRQKLKSMQESKQASENLQQEKTQDILETSSSQPHSDPIVNVEQQPISDPLQDQKDESTPRSDVSTAGNSPKSLTHIEEEEEMKVPPVDEPRPVSSIEEKFRKDIDGLLEENLAFWMRFSGLFHQIQQFQTSIKDLQNEYTKLKQNKNSEESSTSSKHSDSLRSDARPIYKHLREIQTELTVWMEKNMLLKDEVKYRLASLCNIQEEIERVSHHSSGTDEEFSSYQAAKFQGEVLNMEQENNKVAGELQVGLEHVKELQVEIDKTLTQMDEELKLSGSRIHHHHNVIHSLSRTRIPLRSLLFGVRAKKQKQPSFFACINPTLNKQHSDLDDGYAPI